MGQQQKSGGPRSLTERFARGVAGRFVPRRSGGLAAAGAAVVCGGLLVACGGGSDGSGSATSGSTSSGADAGSSASAAVVRPPTRTEEYLPGLEADFWEPATPAAGPVVVLIPGGAWVSAERAGLAPLASALSDAGMTVVSATYRTASSDTYFPDPLQDVLCAVAFAAVPRVTGDAPHPVVVVGHSAGANLAALAALTPEATGDACPYKPVAPDALVGMAGPYDVADLSWLAIALFGVPLEDDPGLWEDGDPMVQAANRAEVPALLLHGEDDVDVDVSSTASFATALEDGGHDVTLEVVPGADHSAIYRAEVAGDRLVEWITALT